MLDYCKAIYEFYKTIAERFIQFDIYSDAISI